MLVIISPSFASVSRPMDGAGSCSQLFNLSKSGESASQMVGQESFNFLRPKYLVSLLWMHLSIVVFRRSMSSVERKKDSASTYPAWNQHVVQELLSRHSWTLYNNPASFTQNTSGDSGCITCLETLSQPLWKQARNETVVPAQPGIDRRKNAVKNMHRGNLQARSGWGNS